MTHPASLSGATRSFAWVRRSRNAITIPEAQ